jgi:hypothetical protein
VQSIEVPVVESLLCAPGCDDGVSGFSFLDQRFRLAALDALGEKVLAKSFHSDFRLSDSRCEGFGTPFRGVSFFQSCEPVRQFTALCAGDDEMASIACTNYGGGESSFELSEVTDCGFEGEASLFFFDVEDTEQTLEAA